MPNWCINHLLISGDQNPIADFRSRMRPVDGEITLSFNDFVPMPQEEEENWYDWSVEHWGCKWDLNPDDTEVTLGEDELRFSFQTAWGPPEAWLKTVSGMFPTLRFDLDYDEPGMDFGGQMVYVNEVMVVEHKGRSQDNMQKEDDDIGDFVKDAPYAFIDDIGDDGRLVGDIYADTYTDEYYERTMTWGFSFFLHTKEFTIDSGTTYAEALLIIKEALNSEVDDEMVRNELQAANKPPTYKHHFLRELGGEAGLRLTGFDRDDDEDNVPTFIAAF
jgi:hypothetical protein